MGLFVPHDASPQDYDAAVSALVLSVAKSLSATNKRDVAILDFTDLNGKPVCLGQLIAEEISIGLVTAAQGIQVVTRNDSKLRAVLAEQKLAAGGMIEPQSAAKVAQLLGVQALLTGTINLIGDRVRVTTTLVDSTTARLVGGASASIPRTKTIDDFVAQCGTPSVSTANGGAGGPQASTQLAKTGDLISDGFRFQLKSCLPRFGGV